MATNDRMTRSLQRQIDELNQLPEKAYEYWRRITPVASGNARRRTSLRGNTIHAAYPYAERLDQGYSRQAPDGMTKPTEKEIQRIVNGIAKK